MGNIKSEPMKLSLFGSIPSNLLFDSLPYDVLRKILLWLEIVRLESLHANTNKSCETDGLHFLTMLFSQHSTFRPIISSMIHELHFDSNYGVSAINISSGRITFGPEIFEGVALKSGLLHQILRNCGTFITKISFKELDISEKIRGNDMVEQFMPLVVQHCPDVTSILFSTDYVLTAHKKAANIVLREYSFQLNSIEWWDENYPDLSNCIGLQRLECANTQCSGLISQLMSCGSTLHELCITFVNIDGVAEVVDAIEFNCDSLSSIKLINIRDVVRVIGEERYTSFLTSYGAQLTSADVTCLSYDSLNRVIRACPNLELKCFEVKGIGSQKWQCAGIIGSRLESLLIDFNSSRREDCLRALETCTNLRYLSIYGYVYETETTPRIANEMIVSVFQTSFFRPLEILTLEDFTATANIISLIASKTSRLKRLYLEPCGPIESGSVFGPIVDSNPQLSTVRLHEDLVYDAGRSADSALEILSELVCVFSKCRVLDFGILNTDEVEMEHDIVRDVCGSLPCRGVNVTIHIGSTVYVQNGRL